MYMLVLCVLKMAGPIFIKLEITIQFDPLCQLQAGLIIAKPTTLKPFLPPPSFS